MTDPADDPDACETCHGTGEFACERGCHAVDCPDCEATGDRDPGPVTVSAPPAH